MKTFNRRRLIHTAGRNRQSLSNRRKRRNVYGVSGVLGMSNPYNGNKLAV
jgi:hypothetical protein